MTSPANLAPLELTPSERVFLNGSRFASPRRARGRVRWRRVISTLYAGALLAIPGLVAVTFLAQGGAAAVLSGFAIVVILGLLGWIASGILEQDRTGLAPALDGRGDVAADELVTTMVAAAFLAREEAGAIALEVTGSDAPALRVRVVNHAPSFPRASLEHRLETVADTTCDTLIYEWMVTTSRTPWSRMLEQVVVMATVRGLVKPSAGDGAQRWGQCEVVAGLAADPGPVLAIVDRCRQSRPEVWRLLGEAVRSAVRMRTNVSSDAPVEADPWLDEARADREGAGRAAPDHRKWIFLVPGLVSWMVAIEVLVVSTSPRLVWGWIAAASAICWLAAKAYGPFASRQAAVFAFGPPLVAAIGVIGTTRPVLILPMTAVLVLIGTTLWLRARARQALRLAVTGAPTSPLVRPSQEPGHGPPAGLDPPRARVVLPFRLEIRRADALPPLSPASQKRLDDVNQRGPVARAAYMRSVTWLAGVGSAVALTLSLWQATLPFLHLIFLVLTIGYFQLNRRTERLRERLRANPRASVDQNILAHRNMTVMRRSPRLYGFSGLGWLWVGFFALQVPGYVLSMSIAGWIGASAIAAAALTWVRWHRRQQAELQRRFPHPPPLELLALRVFNSPYLDDFLDLIDLWQWVGTRQRLEGPDTAGHGGRELVSYVSGRISALVTEDDAELQEALEQFRRDPDRDLRFPMNTLQCSDAIWRKAVQGLVDRADVVVADLSAMTNDNRGVAYEIGLLFERMPLSRVVLLVHDSTDLTVLEEVVATAAGAMTSASPNYGGTTAPMVIHLGGSTARLEEESVHEWRRRLQVRIDDERLVGVLMDAAMPPRTAQREPMS